MKVILENKRLKEIIDLITEVSARLEFLKERYAFINEEYGDLVDDDNNLFNLRKSIIHSERVLNMLTNLKNNYQTI